MKSNRPSFILMGAAMALAGLGQSAQETGEAFEDFAKDLPPDDGEDWEDVTEELEAKMKDRPKVEPFTLPLTGDRDAAYFWASLQRVQETRANIAFAGILTRCFQTRLTA